MTEHVDSGSKTLNSNHIGGVQDLKEGCATIFQTARK
jgi:hypothetical protein